MKKYEVPEINIIYFLTEDITAGSAESVTNILDTEEKKVQIGSLNFEELK